MFIVWGFGLFSKSSESNLQNYFLHYGFKGIQLIPMYLEETHHQSLQGTRAVSSSEVLSQLDCLQSQIYGGSELLFIPPLCPPWGCYFLGSTHAKHQIRWCTEPLKPTSRLPVFATEKKSKSQISAGKPASSWALDGVTLPDWIQSGRNAPARCAPEDCSLHLEKKVFVSIHQYPGVVSWTLAPLWMQPKRLLALPAQQSLLVACPLFSTCPCVISWITGPRINFFLQRLTLRLNILLIIPRFWCNKPTGTKQEVFFPGGRKNSNQKLSHMLFKSRSSGNSEWKSLIFLKFNYVVQFTALQKWKFNFSERNSVRTECTLLHLKTVR